jgi:hypothetical protein
MVLVCCESCLSLLVPFSFSQVQQVAKLEYPVLLEASPNQQVEQRPLRVLGVAAAHRMRKKAAAFQMQKEQPLVDQRAMFEQALEQKDLLKVLEQDLKSQILHQTELEPD